MNKDENVELKIENWNGNDIRFINLNGQWYGVLKDVCDALDLKTYHVAEQLREYQERRNKKGIGNTDTLSKNEKLLDKSSIPTAGGKQKMLVVSEKGIYRLISQSHKEEAEDFQDWFYDILVELRQASGLESYESFRMVDKEIQKDITARLYEFTHPESNISVIKANTIANKATSNMYGLPKLVKKGDMTPEMQKDRQAVYNDTVNLMIAQKAFDLDISVSKMVYAKYSDKKVA